MTKPKDDLINDENELKVSFAKWEENGLQKMGRSYKGVYVARRIAPNALKGGDAKQAVYTLAEASMRDVEGADEEDIEGGLLMISGRGNQNPAVIPQLELCKLGQVVAIKYTEQKDPRKAGQSGAKILRVYTKHEMKPEVLAAFTMGGEVVEGDGLAPADEVIK